jgi:hypothetical protein
MTADRPGRCHSQQKGDSTRDHLLGERRRELHAVAPRRHSRLIIEYLDDHIGVPRPYLKVDPLHRRTVRFALAGVAVLCACGADTSGPKATGIAGAWRYSTSVSSSQGGLVCTVTDAKLTLTQRGDTIVGTYTNGALVCGTQTNPYSSGTVSGLLSGSAVDFALSSVGENTGSWNGDSMSGETTVAIDISSGIPNLTGTWSATRVGR